MKKKNSNTFARMAAYELLLRVADCRMKLLTVALNAEIEKLFRQEFSPRKLLMENSYG